MKHTKVPYIARGQEVLGPHGVSVAWCGEATTTGSRGGYSIRKEEAQANAEFIALACNCHGPFLEIVQKVLGKEMADAMIKEANKK